MQGTLNFFSDKKQVAYEAQLILNYFLAFKTDIVLQRGNVPGIYVFYNKQTKQAYIGETVSIKKRLKQHLTPLKTNKHPNKKLQKAVNQYGLNNFDILCFSSAVLACGFFRKAVENFIIKNWPAS